MNESADVVATTKPKMASISAVITRADGTKEDLGVIAYYHRNPLRMAWWNITKSFKEFVKCIKQRIQ